MRSARAWLIVIDSAGPILTAQTPNAGKQVFDTRCAICHGEDANGGEFAPGIVTRIAARTDSEIGAVVRMVCRIVACLRCSSAIRHSESSSGTFASCARPGAVKSHPHRS